MMSWTKRGSHGSMTNLGDLSITGKLCGICPMLSRVLVAVGTKDSPAQSNQGFAFFSVDPSMDELTVLLEDGAAIEHVVEYSK